MASRPDPNIARGLSLVELVIVLLVVGIMAVIAYPGFMGQLLKTRRIEAIAALAQVQQAQERWRANHPTYADTLATLGLSSPASGRYLITIDHGAADGYTATAHAAGAQAVDTACSSLSLTLGGGTTRHASTGSALASVCWNR
ncbi:type IV pilin protein [Methylibium sp.]|jgi:type IV pilus assembly protein PilE|uniref:type IV pilin protein n=1 Tax=Methylibium sp. TaxID=2067992 RepID=UPI003D0BD7C5